MSKLFGKPDGNWLVPAVFACGLLVAAMVLPLWRMELVAPQYPAGLIMYAFGDRFEGDGGTYYDDVREINGLNHYIGMKPIQEVTEMDLFLPGMAALIAVTVVSCFIAWKKSWLRALIVAGFWFMPLFFVADLQYWLYTYGHTMDPDAALDTSDFTPKVIGTTKVWNFHSESAFEPGFYAMMMAALAITIVPPAIAIFRRRRAAGALPEQRLATASAQQHAGPGVAYD